jgi:uncharacterized membrane protein YkoI
MPAFSDLSSGPGHSEAEVVMKSVLHIAAWLALAVLAGTAAVADSGRHGRRGGDHDDAYSARVSGDVLPLAELLAIVHGAITGEIIETEFKYDDGRPVYEFKYVDPAGRVRELYLDARSGAVLEHEFD